MDKSKSREARSGRIPPRQKILGPNKLQINENNASMLIGSIVEKGVSDVSKGNTFAPIPPPRATVLPFPVARHRSHGPHWVPVDMSKDHAHDGDDRDVDDVEDMKFATSNRIAAFASPVPRKEKKGLDLRDWKQVLLDVDKPNVSRDSSLSCTIPAEVDREPCSKLKPTHDSDGTSMDGQNSAIARPVIDMDGVSTGVGHYFESNKNVDAVDSCRDSGSFSESSLVTASVDENGSTLHEENDVNSLTLDHSREVGKQSLRLSAESPSKSDISQNGQSHLSLESQIHAENCARLQSMSPDEIAQSQAELRDKMDPSLLQLLKRRGQQKLMKQNSLGSETGGGKLKGSVTSQSIQNSESLNISSKASSFEAKATAKDSQSSRGGAPIQNLGPRDSSLWRAWSERVEAARHLRSSLEGTIVESNVELFELHGADKNRQNTDNVAKRDYLRTEGDPGAAGYTIKEAIELTRSVVPGQRALALHLLASVLDKAIQNICQDQVAPANGNSGSDKHPVDWEAVWAFALGPEPELVLTLRMSLDDSHSSVILACARVIQCILSCDLNESFFDNLERMSTHGWDVKTAPIFRSKPEIDAGFSHGGFWKYSAKSSNVLPIEEISDFENEDKRTIQDDIVVAGQDVVAGLVRMGILPRILYILETDPAGALEESLMSVLIAIARHSPTAARAIMECPRLIQTVVHRFTMKSSVEIQPSQIKSVCLFKVLARANRKYCEEFVESGTFKAITWQLYQPAHSLDHWINLGRELCKLTSSLMVEQLRLWRTFINYGYCIACFPDIFPSMCLWLSPPRIETLLKNNILREFTSVSSEAYLVLATLACKLPNFYSQKPSNIQNTECTGDGTEAWAWSYVPPMVHLAIEWIDWKGGPCASEFFDIQRESLTSLLWVYSSVVQMLSVVLERVDPDNTIGSADGVESLPWLPDFVPKIGTKMIMNGFFRSFMEQLCQFRCQSSSQSSLASVCCLHGLFQLMVSIDHLIQLAKSGIAGPPIKGQSTLAEERILEEGILKGSHVELLKVLNIFLNLSALEWRKVQSIETFGRGGPAPGVGAGWGASGGGYWSTHVLLAQKDASLLICLLEKFPVMSENAFNDGQSNVWQRINGALGICLIAGPRDRVIVEKALNFLLQVPILKFLNIAVQRLFALSRRSKSLSWEYGEEDLHCISELLCSHWKKRWLCLKKKKADVGKVHKKSNLALETIHECIDMLDEKSEHASCTSLIVEWAHQRLPLPMHWFASTVSTCSDDKHSIGEKASSDHDRAEVAKAGMFFLLGLEAMSFLTSTNLDSPVQHLSLVWKLHFLSMISLNAFGVLEEQKSRDIFEALQDLFGQLIDQEKSNISAKYIPLNKLELEFLRFKSEIHDSYSTFIEVLVEQFAAISFGDILYGRQVAIYLYRHVEAPVRFAAWNALSNARVLDLLPPLDNCLADGEGYLEPPENDEKILEAYVKSWVSGALDRAAVRGSLALTLVLHHLSSFIFLDQAKDQTSLRNKLVKSLLRDCSRKQQREKMMKDLIQYNAPLLLSHVVGKDEGVLRADHIRKRMEVLKEACEGNVSLLAEVEKLSANFGLVQR